MRYFYILLLSLLYETPGSLARCPDHSFIGCMLRLKTQRVPIEKNILSLIFNIGTESRLLHTCKVYSATLPCFQEKIRECGDEKQKRIINEVSKTIMYLCSPFSMQRQKAVLHHQKCISAVLSLPASTGCNLEDHDYGRQVLTCKKECSSRGSDFICMMRTWISEQNTCTLRDIEQKCGEAAAELFVELQTTVFEPAYPVVCNYGNETLKAIAQKVAQEKKIKQHRKPLRKSKTEVQEHALILTSPRPIVVSTVDNIYITPVHPIQTNIYMRPDNPNLSHIYPMINRTATNAMSFYPSQHQTQQTGDYGSNIWKKGGDSQKVQYNKEVWRQKTTSGEFVFSTQHPLFTTTEPGATPKRHKVIDILKSLIPANLPSQLTALLENSYDKETFPESHTYNTPPMNPTSYVFATERVTYPTDAVPLTTVSTTKLMTAAPTTMIPPKPVVLHTFSPYRPVSQATQPTTSSISYQQQQQSITTKWKPWYLGGA